MTFGALIQRLGRPLQLHESEYVTGPDGLAHLIIVTRTYPEPLHGADVRWSYWFGCPCGALEGLRPETLEVAKQLTCMRCVELS